MIYTNSARTVALGCDGACHAAEKFKHERKLFLGQFAALRSSSDSRWLKLLGDQES